jgi:hypothetical protein
MSAVLTLRKIIDEPMKDWSVPITAKIWYYSNGGYGAFAEVPARELNDS